MHVRSFNPQPDLPARAIVEDLILMDQRHRARIEAAAASGQLVSEQRTKLAQCIPLSTLLDRVGSRPVLKAIGAKDPTDEGSLREYCRWFYTACAILGITLNQGAGPSIMKLAAEEYWYALERVRKFLPENQSLWEALIIGVALDITGEPLHHFHTPLEADDSYDPRNPGAPRPLLVSGPWRTLLHRTDALFTPGIAVGVNTFLGGTSTIVEMQAAIAHNKPSQRDEIDTPFSGYPHDVPMLQVDLTSHPFYGTHIHGLYQGMVHGPRERQGRKGRELAQLRSQLVTVNGDNHREAAETHFAFVDAAIAAVYGAPGSMVWQHRNGIHRPLFDVVAEMLEKERQEASSK